MVVALFPGTFDPITNGHLDIIERSAKVFDQVVVVIMENTTKKAMFDVDERGKLITDAVKSIQNVTVKIGQGLTVDQLKINGADVLIRGLRNSTDYEFEKSIAGMNREMNAQVETLFMLTNPSYQSIASSMVKEIATFNGDISPFVPRNVEKAVKARFGK